MTFAWSVGSLQASTPTLMVPASGGLTLQGSLEVRDPSGSVGRREFQFAVPNSPPVPKVAVLASNAGLRLDATASVDLEGDTLTAQWSVGNTTLQGLAALHVPPAPQVIHVTLRLSDSWNATAWHNLSFSYGLPALRVEGPSQVVAGATTRWVARLDNVTDMAGWNFTWSAAAPAVGVHLDHAFLVPGPSRILLAATDGTTQLSASHDVTVVAAPPPSLLPPGPTQDAPAGGLALLAGLAGLVLLRRRRNEQP